MEPLFLSGSSGRFVRRDPGDDRLRGRRRWLCGGSRLGHRDGYSPAGAGAGAGVATVESLRDCDCAPAFASRPTRAWRTRPPSARGPASSWTSCASVSDGVVATSDPSGAGAGSTGAAVGGGRRLGRLFSQHAVGLHDPLADIRHRLLLERPSVLVVIRTRTRHGHVRRLVGQLYGFAARLEVDARCGIPTVRQPPTFPR